MNYPQRCDNFKAKAGPDLKMWFREGTSDYNTILSVTHDDEYLVSELGVKPGGIYVDVGSHIGSWAVLVAALGGEVWAYEPIPENLQLIIRNAQANGVEDRVHVRWGAVSGEPGYECIYYANPATESGQHHRFIGTFNTGGLSVDSGPSPDYIHVPRVSLAQVLADVDVCQVAAMKVDCEGAEWGFLGTATAQQLNCFDRLMGEHHAIHGHAGRAELFELCRGVFVDRTEDEDSNLGLFYFERNLQWT